MSDIAAAPLSAGDIGMEALASGGTDAAPEVDAGQIGMEAMEGGEEAAGEETRAEPTKEAKAAKKAEAARRKLKFKLDGKETDWEGTDDDLARLAQKGLAADKRFEESSKLAQTAKTLLKLAKEDPRAFLEHPDIGADVKALARQALQAEIKAQMEAEEDAALPPEARKAKQLERELASLKAEKEKAAKQAEESKREAALKESRVGFEREIMEVLDASDLPKDQETALLVVEEIQAALQRDEPYDVKDIVERVAKRETGRIGHLMQRMGPTKFFRLFPEARKAFRELEVSELKAKNPFAGQKPQVSTEAKTKREPVKATPKSEGELKRELSSLDAKGWAALLGS